MYAKLYVSHSQLKDSFSATKKTTRLSHILVYMRPHK